MTTTLDHRWTQALEDLARRGRRRAWRTVESRPSAHVKVNGRDVINFASNNYLALAEDPRVSTAAGEAARVWGSGSTGSRLMGGTFSLHEQLEADLARFKETQAALLFPSGYHANLGMIPAVAGPEDTVYLDRLAHASLVDGARLSRARVRVFRHNDVDDLDHALGRDRSSGERWIVTESVFSMDGDRAPLRDLAAVAGRRRARLYVDEAHATGVWGPDGRGGVNADGVVDRVDVVMGTLSKALGAQGGFVCGSVSMAQWALNTARSFIYSTALTPSTVAAARKALELLGQEPDRRERVWKLSGRLRTGLGVSGEGPIVPWRVGEEEKALALSARLWEAGIFAPAVRFPTVPRGAARIRFSVTAAHTEGDIDRVLEALGV